METLEIFRRARAVYLTPDHTIQFQTLWNQLEDEIHELPPPTLDDLRAWVARLLSDREAAWDLRVGAMVLDTMLDY
jgi:hypothetical protein